MVESPYYSGLAALLLMCCSVAKYITSNASLLLQHNYPAVPASSSPVASVDVNLLLSTLKPTDTHVGEWVNVMGYVTSQSVCGSRAERPSEASKRATVSVQAIMLWSAGSIKLGDYERILAERKEVEKRLRAPP